MAHIPDVGDLRADQAERGQVRRERARSYFSEDFSPRCRQQLFEALDNDLHSVWVECQFEHMDFVMHRLEELGYSFERKRLRKRDGIQISW
jgi:hypothetical protein